MSHAKCHFFFTTQSKVSGTSKGRCNNPGLNRRGHKGCGKSRCLIEDANHFLYNNFMHWM